MKGPGGVRSLPGAKDGRAYVRALQERKVGKEDRVCPGELESQ